MFFSFFKTTPAGTSEDGPATVVTSMVRTAPQEATVERARGSGDMDRNNPVDQMDTSA